MSEFYNNITGENRVQDRNFNQLKLKVNGSYKKDEKRMTNAEASIDEDVVNKTHLDAQLSKVEGHVTCIKINSNIKPLNEPFEGEVSVNRAVKMTSQLYYGIGLFDQYKKCR